MGQSNATHCCVEVVSEAQEPIEVTELLLDASETVPLVKHKALNLFQDGVSPLLPDGSTIEYFSRTKRIWVPGLLEVNVESHSPIVGPQVSYNVRTLPGTPKERVRKDVPPNSFREPLQEGEELELFSRSRGSRWVPCRLSGPQAEAEEDKKGRNSWGYRYKVRLDLAAEGTPLTDDQVLERVPPARLRRRFPPGSRVSMYRGPDVGYCPAVVDPAAAAAVNPDDLTELEAAFSMGPAVGGTLLSTMSGASVGSIFSEYSMPAVTGPSMTVAVLKPVMLGAPDPSDSSDDEYWDEDDEGSPWYVVPTREMESSKYVLAPSYLVQSNKWEA